MTEHSVVASIHLADVRPTRALSVLITRARRLSIAGLRTAEVALATPLRASGLPRPSLRRVGLIALWDDDTSLDRFLETHSLAAAFAEGWWARLRPLRAHGTWPGLPRDLASGRDAVTDEPAIVLTLGRLRLSQARRFLRASRPAEAAALAAPGFVWGTALARPPFVATCSLWESPRAITTYAYGDGERGHPNAIAEQQRKDFHKRSAFIRFAPYGIIGSLSGKNPLPEQALAAR